MATGQTESYQGGSALRLDNFYNGILSGYQRSQQQLAVQQQNEAKRLEAEQKELADMVSKVNTAGVQKIDIPDMTQKLDGLYEKYYQASKAESKADKLLLRAELQQDIQELAQFVGQSKQRGTEQLKLSEFVGSPTNMGLVSSDALTRLKNYSNTPTAKLPTNAFSRESYVSPDTSYVSKTTDSILNDLMKDATVTREFGKAVNVVGKQGVEQFEKQTLAKEVFAEALANRYQNDVKFKNTLDYSSEQSGKTPQQTLLELVNNSTLTKTKQLANEYGYRPRAPRASGESDNEGFVVERDFDINYGERNGKASTVTAREYVAIPTAPTVSAGKFSMVDTDGKSYQSTNTTEKLNLVSVGTFPVIKSDSEIRRNGKKVEDLKAGALATKDYANNNPDKVEYVSKAVINITKKRPQGGEVTTTYFADPREVIARTKLTKNQKEALGAYTKTKGTSTPTVTKTTTTPKQQTKTKISW